MQSALRIETQVLPGNKIEINLPEDSTLTSVGQIIEVIVLLPEQKPTPENQPILALLEEIHKQRPVGRSIEEIN
jgi:acyl-CoA thioesterase FadM